MALDTLTQLLVSVSLAWNVGKSRAGFQSVGNSQNLQHRISFSLGAGADACNELVAFIQTVNASTTTDIDMSAALTNVVNDLAVTLARVKFLFAKLLTAADADDAGTVIGTACS